MEKQNAIIKTHKVITRRKNGTTRVQTINDEKSMTAQEFAPECEVNNIIKKYMKTGDKTLLQQKIGFYADVSEVPDFLTASVQVTQANETFNLLPSELRQRFNHSPAEMINFVSNPNNQEEAIKLGLMVPRPKPAPINDKLNDELPEQKKQPKKPEPKNSSDT